MTSSSALKRTVSINSTPNKESNLDTRELEAGGLALQVSINSTPNKESNATTTGSSSATSSSSSAGFH